MISQPKSVEDLVVDIQFSNIELTAYAHHRETNSYERLKSAGYPNVDELEVRYKGINND